MPTKTYARTRILFNQGIAETCQVFEVMNRREIVQSAGGQGGDDV